jgi:hypothetical protein
MMGKKHFRPVPLLVIALISAGLCSSQTQPASPRDLFEQILSEPASVRLSKLIRQSTTIATGGVERESTVTEADGSKVREYKFSLAECHKMGEPFCPIPDRGTTVRVRADSDPLAFTPPDLALNEHYILFLCRTPQSAYYVMCGNQGIFRLVRNWGDWEWNGGRYARLQDEIAVLSALPTFLVYNQMSFWDFYNEFVQA